MNFPATSGKSNKLDFQLGAARCIPTVCCFFSSHPMGPRQRRKNLTTQGLPYDIEPMSRQYALFPKQPPASPTKQ